MRHNANPNVIGPYPLLESNHYNYYISDPEFSDSFSNIDDFLLISSNWHRKMQLWNLLDNKHFTSYSIMQHFVYKMNIFLNNAKALYCYYKALLMLYFKLSWFVFILKKNIFTQTHQWILKVSKNPGLVEWKLCRLHSKLCSETIN